MASAATGASGTAQAGGAAPSAGQNPFQIATNLYAEKNLQGLLTAQAATTATQQFGGSINAGQYLRGIRLMVRTAVAPAANTTVNSRTFAAGDGAFDLIPNADITNVDGSEILYNMSGFSHYIQQKYYKPWLQDASLRYDYRAPAAAVGGSVTLFLQPEIRFTAGVLANTDTRSQYRLDYSLGSLATPGSATFNVIPYMDAWAQPDAQDLQGTPNQPVPPGVNLQVKRRHQVFNAAASGDNTFLSTLTGNAIRGLTLICRDASSNTTRVDGLSDPIYWYLDNRSLGRLNPDMVRQWAEDQYGTYTLGNKSGAIPGANYQTTSTAVDPLGATGNYAGAGSEDLGVYVFPRFMLPGELYGQGWLYTANSTKLAFESSSANSVSTVELVVDEVYPVGNVDPSLVDI